MSPPLRESIVSSFSFAARAAGLSSCLLAFATFPALAAETGTASAPCAAPLAGMWRGRVAGRDATGRRSGEPTQDLSIELRDDGTYEWYTFASLEVSTQHQAGRWSCTGDRLALDVDEDEDPRVPYEVRLAAPPVARTDAFAIARTDDDRVALVAEDGYRYDVARQAPREPDRPLEPPRTPAETATLGYLRCVVTLGGATLFGDVSRADGQRYAAWMKARPDFDPAYFERNVDAVFRQEASGLFVMGAYERHERGESAEGAIRARVAECLAAMK